MVYFYLINEHGEDDVMENKGCLKAVIIVLMTLDVFVGLFITYINENHMREVEAYNRLIEPMTEYLDNKYIEKMVINEKEFLDYDGARALYASPQNNDEIKFRVFNTWRGFEDEYCQRYAEWEAKCIITPIVEKYCDNFYCYTILTIRFDDIDFLSEYYVANKEHLNWQNYFGKLEFVGIQLYQYDESMAKQNIIDPILSELLKLDFIINSVTFYMYENEGDKDASVTYYYEYDNEEFLPRE